MFARRVGSILFCAAPLIAQAPPSAAEQEKAIAEIRAYAEAYTSKLPDFICAQVTHREVDLAPADGLSGVHQSSVGRSNLSGLNSADRKATDTFEEQLGYFDQKENYQLIKVNGRKQKPGQPRPPGMTSTGEFATTLHGVFDPLSKAQFEWKRWDMLRGQPVWVFAFSIDKVNSTAQLQVPSRTTIVSYHGLVFAQRETYIVLRLTTEVESPKDFPLQDVTRLLDYGRVEIQGQDFVLPLHAAMQTRMSEDFMRSGREGGSSRQVFLRNEVDFREYRKYTAESVLKADSDK